jgi:hypothetical protein
MLATEFGGRVWPDVQDVGWCACAVLASKYSRQFSGAARVLGCAELNVCASMSGVRALHLKGLKLVGW